MEGELQQPQASRRSQIGARLTEIRARIEELRLPPEAAVRTAGQRLTAAERGAAASLAAAEQALAASILAFRRAAEAHDHLARVYEQSAANDKASGDEFQRRSAFHRAAAAEDRQRADVAQQRLTMTSDSQGINAAGN